MRFEANPPFGAMKRQHRSGYVLTLALFCALASGGGARTPVRAQQKKAAEAFTPSDHWSREALRRLAEVGLIEPGAVLASWPMRRSDVREQLRLAVGNSERLEISELRSLARAFLASFNEEFPDQSTKRLGLAGRIEDGWDAKAGLLRAGTTFWVEGVGWRYPGPSPADNASTPFAAGTLSALAAEHLSASVTARIGTSGADVRETYVAGRAGAVDLWAGRRGLGFGSAHGESFVLSGGSLFNGGGVEVIDGVRLPWLLGALGPVRGSALIARMDRSGSDLRPWFAALRVTFAPSASVSIGLSRASMFGGSTNPVRTTARNVLMMFLGFSGQWGKSSDYENQVASVDFLWRTRAGSVPLGVYGEYGVDDTGFAFLRVPGWTVGVEIPSVRGVNALAVGIEHTRLPHSCCGYPPWYQHGPLGDGWTDRGQLLGHSLGGEGNEWIVRWRYDEPRWFGAGGTIYTRARGSENLFSPDHGGRSVGGAFRVSARGTRWLRIKGTTELEHGTSWWNRTVILGTELTF